MITVGDKAWLTDTYSEVVPSDERVAGTIEFTATYNAASNQFLILNGDVIDDVGGVRLTCRYDIRIERAQPRGFSALPLLYVTGVNPIADRHFRRNSTACLCSPIEEEDFLTPEFEFKRFLEQLVIPFLYGQSFYSAHNRWPLNEYAHNSTGLLESFFDRNIASTEKVQELLRRLSLDREAWPQIRAALQRGSAKGHTACFCPKRDHLRRCHPKALAGLRRLQHILRAQSISLPSL